MKVYEKIKEFDDAKHITKEKIRNECYALKYCPLDIEAEHGFIGDERWEHYLQSFYDCRKRVEEILKEEPKDGQISIFEMMI